jgi:tripartite-type tricarboxylate transporter receptor subunit TctC
MAAAPAIALSATAASADYPEKPITLVAPYGPGGASDLASRTLASVIPQYLGQPVLVVNRSGAGGVTGSSHVYNSDPDGYTVMLARIGSHTVSPAMKPGIPYEYDNFTYVGLLEINPVICATSVEKPYESFEDLINAIKEKPGELSYSSAGVGTLLQVASVMVLDEAGVENPVEDAIHVPFNSGGQAATAAATGQVDFVCTNSSALMSNIQGGKLRPLLVTTEERLDDVPDAPTVSELGHPELEVLVGWSGIAGPPDMPEEVVNTWADALQKVKEDDSWNKLVTQLGSVPKVLPPDETLEFVKKQYSVFSDLIERFDMKVE